MKFALVSPALTVVLCDIVAWGADALVAAGHEVRRVHDLAGVVAADAACDVLLFDHKHAGLNWNSLAELGRSCSRRSIWLQWWRDLVATDPATSLAKQANMVVYGKVMRVMDAVLVKERSLLDDFRDCGVNARWFDQACPAEMPACDHPAAPDWDVLVLGSISYPQRYDDARTLAAAGYRVLWAGLTDCITVPEGCDWRPWAHPLRELPQLVSRCALVLGVDWRSDLPGYTSARSYLVAGMGACYIARSADYGDHALGHSPAAQVAAWIYDCRESLLNVVRRALNHPEERRSRGELSRQLVLNRHTYHHRARELLELVCELQGAHLMRAAGATC